MAKTVRKSVWRTLLRQHKEQILRQALAASGGNRTKAAKALGITREYISVLIRTLTPDLRREPMGQKAPL